MYEINYFWRVALHGTLVGSRYSMCDIGPIRFSRRETITMGTPNRCAATPNRYTTTWYD